MATIINDAGCHDFIIVPQCFYSAVNCSTIPLFTRVQYSGAYNCLFFSVICFSGRWDKCDLAHGF